MELLKTEKRGRPDNNKKHEGKYFLSIRRTRGTMTDATAAFLGLHFRYLSEAMIGFLKDGNKNYVRVAKEGDDISHYKKLSNVNGRWGVYTKNLVISGQLKEGEYEVLPEDNDGSYEIVRIPKNKIKSNE